MAVYENYLVIQCDVREFFGSVFNKSALDSGKITGSWPIGMIIASMKKKGVFYKVIKGTSYLQDFKKIEIHQVNPAAIRYLTRTIAGVERDKLIRRRRDGTVVEHW